GGGALLGLWRGFVTEILSLFAWVAAIFALKLAHAPVAALLTGFVGTGAGAAVLAFALIFLVVFVAGKMVAGALGRRTRQSVLGPIDRVLGFGFGALKGLIGATLLFLLANLATDTVYGGDSARPEWMRASQTFPLLNASSRAIVDFVEMRRTAGKSAKADGKADRK
ncbi:MAG: colicin production protein, partial [Sphingomonas bacterium]|nr:colicin production protein [Sphingomonas bacterium]